MRNLLVVIFILAVVGCSDTRYEIVDYSGIAPAVTSTPEYNEDRNAYFGDTHIHTKYSFDAYIFGTTATPDDAYRFAQGDTIQHPLGFDMKISFNPSLANFLAVRKLIFSPNLITILFVFTSITSSEKFFVL